MRYENKILANSSATPLCKFDFFSVNCKRRVRNSIFEEYFVGFLQKPRVRDLVTFWFHGHCSRMRRFCTKIDKFRKNCTKRFLMNAAWSNFESSSPIICMLLLCFPLHGSISKQRVENDANRERNEKDQEKLQNCLFLWLFNEPQALWLVVTVSLCTFRNFFSFFW